jgi:hypothetical protein
MRAVHPDKHLGHVSATQQSQELNSIKDKALQILQSDDAIIFSMRAQQRQYAAALKRAREIRVRKAMEEAKKRAQKLALQRAQQRAAAELAQKKAEEERAQKEAEAAALRKRKHIKTWFGGAFFDNGAQNIAAFIDANIKVVPKNCNGCYSFMACSLLADLFFETQSETADSTKLKFFYRHFNLTMLHKYSSDSKVWGPTVRNRKRGYKGIQLLSSPQ